MKLLEKYATYCVACYAADTTDPARPVSKKNHSAKILFAMAIKPFVQNFDFTLNYSPGIIMDTLLFFCSLPILNTANTL
jgi:hypothetical protein